MSSCLSDHIVMTCQSLLRKTLNVVSFDDCYLAFLNYNIGYCPWQLSRKLYMVRIHFFCISAAEYIFQYVIIYTMLLD